MIKLKNIIESISDISGKTLIVVDVQPEYQKYIRFIPKLVNYINLNYENMGKLVFLYNGKETLGMISQKDYVNWWYEQGIDEDILNNIDIIDKGYAFFRYCMDSGGLNDDTIANFVRFMYENDIRDSRNMTRDMWAKYLRQYRKFDKKEVFELLHKSEDCVNIPDLMDHLNPLNNIVLCGGGLMECLKEVEIALMALKKNYDILREFTY